MAANRRLVVTAPVISLLSSDEDIDIPALPKRSTSTSTSKSENIRPNVPKKTTDTKPPTRASESDKATKQLKPVEKPRAPRPSASPARKKRTEAITISSSPPASPPARHLEYPSKSFPKIFGALSSDPIVSQSSPVPRLPSQNSVSKSPNPPAKPDSAFAAIFGSDSDSGLSGSDGSARKRCRSPKGKERARSSSPEYTLPPGMSTREFLERLEARNNENELPTKRRKVKKIDLDISDFDPDPNLEPVVPIVDIPPSSSAPTRKQKLTEVEKEARKAEREATRAQKAAEKDALKEQKRLEKEAKLIQKNESQAMATANKLKGSHVDTVPEMIVDMSSDMHVSRVGTQLGTFLGELNVTHAPFNSSVPNVVKWRRKVTSTWDENDDVFVPLAVPEIRNENHVLAVLDAKTFVDLTNAPEELEIYIAQIKSAYPTCKPIIVIEGLAKLVNKSRNDQSRAYAAQVRNRMREGASETVRMNKAAQAVDEDSVEDALLKLQVVHGCLICQTVAYMDTAEAIVSYTQHISQIPYKRAKATLNNSTNFCMDVGQVPSGKTVEDTYNKMLQCVHMSTQGVANAIQSEYPTVQMLFRALLDGGEDVLKDIRVARNGNGRALGPAMSRKIARVFTGTDEWELES
ncbi:hypothetical protein TWF696_000990 [Orbilia brochopaga]|uniref:ERCC4 domain-containing protein n=1 Tax=Orbilia brochopaga TaxID=3140254 RepID=A0AAV9VGI1_9PEZI